MKETIEIKVPTDWAEVSIDKYTKYCEAVKDLKDETEIINHTISILCDISIDIIPYVKIKDLKAIQKSLHKLISKPVNKDIISKININNEVFGFHSKLDEMTMGEYVDIETFSKENDLAKVLSILYRPIVKEQGNRYDIEPYDSDVHLRNAEKFKNLSINIANPVAVFFWSLGNKQLSNFHQSLEKAQEKVSQADMVGLRL